MVGYKIQNSIHRYIYIYNDGRRSRPNDPESRRTKNETCVSLFLVEGVRVKPDPDLNAFTLSKGERARMPHAEGSKAKRSVTLSLERSTQKCI